jgi:hypothetical protein
VISDDWRKDDNRNRPHSALGMMTSAAYAATWTPDSDRARPGAATPLYAV